MLAHRAEMSAVLYWQPMSSGTGASSSEAEPLGMVGTSTLCQVKGRSMGSTPSTQQLSSAASGWKKTTERSRSVADSSDSRAGSGSVLRRAGGAAQGERTLPVAGKRTFRVQRWTLACGMASCEVAG